jgi:hypothetical protein
MRFLIKNVCLRILGGIAKNKKLINKILYLLPIMFKEVLVIYLKIYVKLHKLGSSNLEKIPIEALVFLFNLVEIMSSKLSKN